MKTATFNINNVVRRLSNLLEWLRAAAPDVVCLQELMTPDAAARVRDERLCEARWVPSALIKTPRRAVDDQPGANGFVRWG